MVGALGVMAACSGDAATSSTTTVGAGAGPSTGAAVDAAPVPSAGPGSSVATSEPVPAGAEEIGDRYVPGAGSGGIDVLAYAVDAEIDPIAGRIEGTVVISAELTEAVGIISLDLETGIAVTGVEVDGEATATTPIDRGIEIELGRVGAPGDLVELTVDYGGQPIALDGVVPFTDVGWSTESWGVVAASEPRGTATWVPVVDHPSDKAVWEFQLTVADPFEAVASGQLVERRTSGDGRTTFVWVVDVPMPPHAALLLVADLDLLDPVEVNGVEVTIAAPGEVVGEAQDAVADLGPMIEALERWFGPYPFDGFGVAVAPGPLGFAALETQELVLFDARALGLLGDSVVAHELAHQWFGNHVAIERWDDLWLAEGLATYAEWLWFEASEGQPAQVLADLYLDGAAPAQLLPPGSPPVENLFGPSVYGRSALAFHDLRTRIGDGAFAGLLQTWMARFGGGNASTEDFLALVDELAGPEAAARMQAWAFDDDPPSER